MTTAAVPAGTTAAVPAGTTAAVPARWSGDDPPRFDAPGVREALGRLDQACHLVRDPADPDRIGLACGGLVSWDGRHDLLATAPPLPATRLGSARFRAAHGVRYAYLAGSMANGIASADLVIALARAGYLGSFGAAGLLPDRIGQALDRIAAEIPTLPFAANLIHSPIDRAVERATVELYLTRGVRCVEASAFMDLTPSLVRYRVAGLRRDRAGRVETGNRVIAKVSRPEVAERFLRPAPADLVAGLVADGLVSAGQAELASRCRWPTTSPVSRTPPATPTAARSPPSCRSCCGCGRRSSGSTSTGWSRGSARRGASVPPKPWPPPSRRAPTTW
jgi:hypothetical protein